MTGAATLPASLGTVASWLVSSPTGNPLQGGSVQRLSTRVLEWILAVDMRVVEVVVELRHPVLTKGMTSVTGLGTATAAAVFVGLCYLAEWRRESAVAALSLSLTGLVVFSLMALVQRPFPPQPVCMTSGAEMTPHSFPSGHAAAVTVFTFLSRDSEPLPFAIVGVLAAAIAVSRIYLGTHFLSDTVVGVLIGAGAYLVARRLLDDTEWGRSVLDWVGADEG